MDHRQEGLPATFLLLLAAALFLFGVGGGLLGYMIGARDGEAGADAMVGALGARWETLRSDARSRFDGAIGSAAATLEAGAKKLKADALSYQGSVSACGVIAYSLGEDVLAARDTIKETEFPPLASWRDVLRQSGVPVEAGAPDSAIARPARAFSAPAVIAGIILLSTTVALCFGLACFTILKLRIAGIDRM